MRSHTGATPGRGLPQPHTCSIWRLREWVSRTPVTVVMYTTCGRGALMWPLPPACTLRFGTYNLILSFRLVEPLQQFRSKLALLRERV